MFHWILCRSSRASRGSTRSRMFSRAFCGLCWVALMTPVGFPRAAAADFPPVSELPARVDLPDPFASFSGERIATKEEWAAKRRPELKALFQHYMYGFMPPAPASVRSTVERSDTKYFGGKATKKEILIDFGPPAAPKIHLLLVLPNAGGGPAPVILGLNFCGNHSVLKEPTIALSQAWMPSSCPGCQNNRATEASRGSAVDGWCIEESVSRGFAIATFYNGDVDPDRPDYTDGVQPAYYKPGQKEPGPHDWGTLAAYAWGLQRAVDYLRTDPGIDPERIAVFGHSRNGKAALLAAAFDERIALVIPHQAGCGGTAPSRGKVGETVRQINDRFPHWFTAEFKKFNDHPELLPFDQHLLIALMAPRPVLLSNATEDTWANPEGQFEMLKAADPVYRLLGAEGLAVKSMPELGRLVDGKLGYFIRPGRHSTTREDWDVFLRFAGKHFGRK